MSMFDNYDNLDSNVALNNISSNSQSTYEILDNKLPRNIYSVKGQFIGYGWNYGDEFTFKVSPTISIKVSEDSLIYSNSTEMPTMVTKGYKGQQAYNLVDVKSWTCVGKIEGLYIWVEDDNVIYATNGTKEINFTPVMIGKTLTLNIYNFRWEKIKTYEAPGEEGITCIIDSDTYKIMPSGIYYATLHISDDTSSKLINKFMISIS